MIVLDGRVQHIQSYNDDQANRTILNCISRLDFTSQQVASQNTTDGPPSPLTALRDPGPMPSRQRVDRRATLRCSAVPKPAGPCTGDSVIYFRPKVSPSSDSSADEREPSMRTSGAKRMKKASIRSLYKAKRPLVEIKSCNPSKVDNLRKEASNDGTVAISPGRCKYSTLTPLGTVADVRRTAKIL